MEKVWLKSYEAGVPSSIEEEINQYDSIMQMIEESIVKFNTLQAFNCMGKGLTFQEVDELSLKFASYLQNTLKLQKGDRVAIMMPNILQYPIALLGVLRAGYVVVNVNPLYTARELEHQLKDSGAKTIIIFDGACKVLQEAIKHVKLDHILTTGIGDMLGFPKSLIVNLVVKHVKKLVPEWNIPQAKSFLTEMRLGIAKDYKRPTLNLDDHAFLQYTGGTTGVSKGAILTHRNMIANMLQAKTWIASKVQDGSEILISPLPLYHIFSLTVTMVFISRGGTNVLITNPRDIPGFIKELSKWNFTVIPGVNTLFNGLLNNPKFKDLNFSHLKVTLGGGMAVQKAVAEKWKATTGCALVEAYGLTETSPAACINPLTIKDFNGYIGLPIPSTEVAILDDNENELTFNEPGEIAIRGPQVMKGYWQRDDETAKVMTKNGYFKTGDIGFMTPEGYVKIVDRKKDMILISGFNVYPNEIEDVLAAHPKVLEVAAIGVANEKTTEAVKVFIVKKDSSLTEEEVIEFCRTQLTAYKVPKEVEFRTELPKSNVGKILRKELRPKA